jgi:hypothetical protein
VAEKYEVVTNKFNAGADLSFIGGKTDRPVPALAVAATPCPVDDEGSGSHWLFHPGAYHLGVTINPGRNSLEPVFGNAIKGLPNQLGHLVWLIGFRQKDVLALSKIFSRQRGTITAGVDHFECGLSPF